MCGILGMIGEPREGQWQETHRILESLLLRSMERGRHATGFAAATSPFRRPYLSDMVDGKEPMPASRFIKDNGEWRKLRHRRCSMVLGHVRWATHGDPLDNRNNHPFVSGDGRYVLVHNGIIGNHRDLADQFSLRLVTDCDSEVLLRMIEQSRDPQKGIERILRHVQGSCAVTVYDRKDASLWIAHNGGRSLWTMNMANDRRIFYASTRTILVDSVARALGRAAASQIETLVPLGMNHIHRFDTTGRVTACEPVEIDRSVGRIRRR